jgi:hypothetical protein
MQDFLLNFLQGFFHGLRTIIAREGLAGTYQGVTATIMKQGSNQAIRSDNPSSIHFFLSPRSDFL